MLREVRRTAAKTMARIRVAVGRYVIRAVDDATKVQSVQVSGLAEFEADGVERFQEYGFTSVPPAGAEAVGLAVGGSRDGLVIVASDDRRYRLKSLKSGEVALYDKNGLVLVLGADGFVHIGANPAADFVSLAGKLSTEIAALKTAVDAVVIVPNDGGAALKTGLSTALAAFGSTAATKAKAT